MDATTSWTGLSVLVSGVLPNTPSVFASDFLIILVEAYYSTVDCSLTAGFDTRINLNDTSSSDRAKKKHQ